MHVDEFIWNNLHIIVPVVGTVCMPFLLKWYKGKQGKMNNDVTDILIQVRKKQAQISKQVK